MHTQPSSTSNKSIVPSPAELEAAKTNALWFTEPSENPSQLKSLANLLWLIVRFDCFHFHL